MRGLFEKDIRLLLQRKNLIFIALVFALGISQSGAFILGYFPFFMLMVMISTISYDEMDNGYQFLMTLPVTRKLYVQEKYLLCILGAMSFWIIAGILYFFAKLLRHEVIIWEQELPTIAVFLPVVFVMLAVVIPVQLQYGAEKSRLVLLCGLGLIFAGVYLVTQLIGEERVTGILQKLDALPAIWMLMAGVGIMLIVTIPSFLISCRIMERKEL